MHVINILTCKTFGGCVTSLKLFSYFLGGYKKYIGHIWTIINGLESWLCICNDRMYTQVKIIHWFNMGDLCFCLLSFIFIIEQQFFSSYNILCVTSKFFIPTFPVGAWTLWEPHLFRQPMVNFLYKAILPPNFKVSLKYPGHVLCPQFELGTAA